MANETYTIQQPTQGASVHAGAHISEGSTYAILGAAAAVLYLLRSTAPSTAVTTTVSGVTSVTTPSSPAISTPGAPVSLTQTGSTTNSVTLTWSPVEGAVEYQIWQYSPRTLLGQTTTNQATITGLNPNTHYEVFIVALNVNGTAGSPSQPLLVITASSTQTATVPSIPGGFTVQAVSPTSVTFTWLADTGATFYQIMNQTTGQTSAPIQGTQATLSGLTPNNRYSFTLEACNSVGCSGPSTLIQATTSASQVSQAAPPAAPSSLSASNITTTGATLTWTASSGATGYTLMNVSDGANLQSGITATAITVSGLTSGTAYDFAVQACNGYGCSGSSPTASFTTASSTTPPSSVGHPVCPSVLPSTAQFRCGEAYLSMGEDPASSGDYWVCKYVNGAFDTGFDQPIAQSPAFTAGTIAGGVPCSTTPPTSNCQTTYTVVTGNNLWDIALHFYGNGALWHVLYNANGSVVGPNPNYILPGERLCIPPRSVGISAAPQGMPYLVEPGDNLSSLALRFYGNASDYPVIARANGIGPPYTIYVGHIITIPPLGG